MAPASPGRKVSWPLGSSTAPGCVCNKAAALSSNCNPGRRLRSSLYENCRCSHLCINGENPQYSAKNPQRQEAQVLYRFYNSKFDPKLQEVIKKWPEISSEIKAAILKMILCLLLVFAVGCQREISEPKTYISKYGSPFEKVNPAEEKRDMERKRFEVIAHFLKKYTDSKKTIEEIACDIAYLEYLHELGADPNE